jgi:hypothetical protein
MEASPDMPPVPTAPVKTPRKPKAKPKAEPEARAKPITKRKAKAKPKVKAKRKAVRKGRPLVRTCRMDIRLAPAELAKLKRVAKAKDISATAMLVRLIEKAA